MNEENLSETYRILIGQLQFEGKLIWTRNQVFLILNSAMIAVLSVGGQDNSSIPITFAASLVGVVLCILWLLAVERSKAYYQYWVTQARAIEKRIKQSVIILEKLHRANSGEIVKIDDEEFYMKPIARYASISRITRIVAFAFIIVWIGLAIAIIV